MMVLTTLYKGRPWKKGSKRWSTLASKGALSGIDKKMCPSCGAIQKYDEIVNKRIFMSRMCGGL